MNKHFDISQLASGASLYQGVEEEQVLHPMGRDGLRRYFKIQTIMGVYTLLCERQTVCQRCTINNYTSQAYCVNLPEKRIIFKKQLIFLAAIQLYLLSYLEITQPSYNTKKRRKNCVFISKDWRIPNAELYKVLPPLILSAVTKHVMKPDCNEPLLSLCKQAYPILV